MTIITTPDRQWTDVELTAFGAGRNRGMEGDKPNMTYTGTIRACHFAGYQSGAGERGLIIADCNDPFGEAA